MDDQQNNADSAGTSGSGESSATMAPPRTNALRTAQGTDTCNTVAGRGIKVGANFPWGAWKDANGRRHTSYGWDFGEPPGNWQRPTDWWQTVDGALQKLADLNIFAVRWFILGDGTNYGAARKSPAGAWELGTPPPLSQAFKDDFKTLLQKLAAKNLKFVPSLIDFKWCSAAQLAAEDAQHTKRWLKGGRAYVLKSASMRSALLDNALQPLLDVSAQHSDVIYAWELMNEPEWITIDPGFTGGTAANKVVPLNDMLDFLKDGIGRINDAGFKSTIGFNQRDTIPRLGRAAVARFGESLRYLGVTLHQFHYYPHQRTGSPLARNTFDPRWPAFIGEFATKCNANRDGDWPGVPGNPQTVSARLNMIRKKGYVSAFPWSVNGIDEHTDWSAAAQTGVKNCAIR